jgi:hypothetical protein
LEHYDSEMYVLIHLLERKKGQEKGTGTLCLTQTNSFAM